MFIIAIICVFFLITFLLLVLFANFTQWRFKSPWELVFVMVLGGAITYLLVYSGVI